MLTFQNTPIPDAVYLYEDSVYVPKFCQTYQGLDTDATYDKIVATSPWTDPTHDWFKYRGHELRRQKAFWNRSDGPDVDAPPDPLYLYRYPGFQYGSMLQYRPLSRTPIVELLADKLQCLAYNTQPVVINHVIGTNYRGPDDEIGAHSDKIKDITPNSPILSLSFGERRELHMTRGNRRDVYILEPGDLFLLGWQDNLAHKHAIVPVRDELRIERRPNYQVQPRVSLVFRNIATTMSLAMVRDKARATLRKREEKKRPRSWETKGRQRRRCAVNK
jgi:hypothetical protein